MAHRSAACAPQALPPTPTTNGPHRASRAPPLPLPAAPTALHYCAFPQALQPRVGRTALPRALRSARGPQAGEQRHFPVACRAEAGDASTVVESASSAVVTLEPFVKVRLPTGRQGSGVLISAEGLLATAAHVAGMAQRQKGRLRIRLPDGRKFCGQVIWVHPTLDLALVQAQHELEGPTEREGPPPAGLPALELASAADGAALAGGAAVVSAGKPMGWTLGWAQRRKAFGEVIATVTNGIEFLPGEAEEEPPTTHIVHDSCVAAGESGGPLLNTSGQVVGIHSVGDSAMGRGGDFDIAIAIAMLDPAVVRAAAEGAGGPPGAGGGAVELDQRRLVSRAIAAGQQVIQAVNASF